MKKAMICLITLYLFLLFLSGCHEVSASKPETPVSSVRIGANVENADIYVDGSFVGNTPAILRLKDGNHTIIIKKEGFDDYTRTLRVNSGWDQSIRAELNAH